MSRIRQTASGVAFKCPGCGNTHAIPTTGPNAWGWNGSLERPTIQPSIDTTSGHYSPSYKSGDDCWCKGDYGFKCYRCHSIVTDGRIFFCPDSTHKLAGQTVDLLEVA